MSEVHSVSAIELKGKDYTFGIVTPRRAYYVKASSLPEMKEWISALNEIKTQMSQRNTIANDMGDLSLSPQAAAPSTSTSYPQQQQQAHAPSQQAVAKAASSAANATMSVPAVSINIPGKGRYVGPPEPRGGDAFSPLTATTDSDTGAEQYGLSYTSSTGGHSLGSSPGREGSGGANRSGSEVSDQGRGARRPSQRRVASGSGSRRDASAGSSSTQHEVAPASYASGAAGSGGAGGVLSSSDEEEEEDEQLDQAMPLPSLGASTQQPQQQAAPQPQSGQQQQQPQPQASTTNHLHATPSDVQSAPSSGPSELLRDPNRVITQGYLMKQSNRRKGHWRKRWFVLTASRLMYTRSHMDAKAHRQVPIASILDAIEYSSGAGSGAGAGKKEKEKTGSTGGVGGVGSPTVSSPLGGSFSFNAFGSDAAQQQPGSSSFGAAAEGATGEGVSSSLPASGAGGSSALAHDDDHSTAPPPAPPARRQSVVAAAAGMASNVGAGMGMNMGSGHSSSKRMDNSFKIITPKRVFLLCAPTEEEEIKWLSALQALLARSRGSGAATGGAAGGAPAATGAAASAPGSGGASSAAAGTEGQASAPSGLVSSPSMSGSGVGGMVGSAEHS